MSEPQTTIPADHRKMNWKNTHAKKVKAIPKKNNGQIFPKSDDESLRASPKLFDVFFSSKDDKSPAVNALKRFQKIIN